MVFTHRLGQVRLAGELRAEAEGIDRRRDGDYDDVVVVVIVVVVIVVVVKRARPRGRRAGCTCWI